MSPPLFSAVAAVEGQPGHLLLAEPPHASRCTSSTARCPRACALLSVPRAQNRPRPPPWRARDRARRSLLSRAAALQVPQLANPSVLLLFPHSDTSERRHRPYPRRRAHPRRRPTIPELLHPYRPRQKLCLVPTKLTDRFSSPKPHRSHPAAVLRAPTAAARRGPPSSSHFFRDPRASKGSPRPPLRFPHPKPRRR